MKNPQRLTGHPKLKKAMLMCFATLTAVSTTASQIAFENASQINDALNIQPYQVVTKENGGEGSGEYPRYFETSFDSIDALKEESFKTIEEAVGEGAVLLKNDNHALPLAADENKVTLLGLGSYDPVYSGTGSGATSADSAVNFKMAMENAGLSVNQTVWDWYSAQPKRENQSGVKLNNYQSTGATLINEVNWSSIADMADSMDGNVAVFTVSRVGGEGKDLFMYNHPDGKDGDYLQLNDNERSILEGLNDLKAAGRIQKIVVVINSANALSCDFMDDPAYGIDAAVWVGTVGQTGLNALGKILTGAINPSGSLPDTFWANNRLNPVMTNFGSNIYENCKPEFSQKNGDDIIETYVAYQEGIYVGYRYTETRYEDVVTGRPNAGDFQYDEVVKYPFGYGLSYTTFAYSDLEYTKDTGSSSDSTDTKYTVSVKVTNTGNVPGKEAVQVYLQKPYTDYDVKNGIEKSAIDFVGYGKTGMLNPGESEIVTVEVPEYFFASFDRDGAGTYIIEAGDYYLTVGTDAHNAVNNVLAAKGYAAGDGNKDMTLAISLKDDYDSYKWAVGTSNEVKPLFDLADMNRYEGRGDNTITYITRSDWEGTTKLWKDTDGDGFSDDRVVFNRTEQMEKDANPDEQDLLDMSNPSDQFPVYGSTATAYKLIDLRVDSEGNPIDYDADIWDDYLDQYTYEQLGTIVANGLHLTSMVNEQGKILTHDENGPAGYTKQYTLGENGYAVQNDDPRKEESGTSFPCNAIIAASMNDELAEKVGEMIGEDCTWAGVSGIYGTGVNIHRSPYSGRCFEYYSEDGVLTGLIAASECTGIQSKGVYVYNKHLALNDQEMNRQGIATWANEQTIREIYLRAFELPIVNQGDEATESYASSKCVMTSFNRFGCVWSAGCKALMTDWLHNEAGLQGFSVTDYFGNARQKVVPYMTKTHMVMAGNDLSDGNEPDFKQGDYEAGSACFADYAPGGSKENASMALAIRESAHRILYTVVHSRGMDGVDADTTFIAVTPWWETTLRVSNISLGILAGLCLVWIVAGEIAKASAKSGKKER